MNELQRGGLMEEDEGSGVWLPYFDVDSLDDAAARFGERLLRPKTCVPGQGWFVIVDDPATGPFALWQKA